MMGRSGRPLRFLGAVLSGWLLFRLGAWTLGPTDRQGVELPVTPVASVAVPMRHPAGVLPPVFAKPIEGDEPHPRSQSAFANQPTQQFGGAFEPERMPSVRSVEAPVTDPATSIAFSDPAERFLPLHPSAAHRSPWSLTAWLLWRPETGASLGPAPLLGGSQAGVRMDYRLWERGGRSFGIYARLTRAFEQPFAEEAAIGVAVRPIAGLPVALLAERRIRLGEGGRDDFALLAAGGVAPRLVAPRLELEGYAQAGIVGFEHGDGFADGRLSVAYRLTDRRTRPDVAFGISAWASAQPGASRVDLGPELRIRLPVGDGALRLSAEWRQRIAGSARPASGPAVTLVADF